MVRYVGKSSSGTRRARSHSSPSQNKNTYRANWIKSLRSAGHEFEIAILQESTEQSLNDDECWWIAYGRACGWPLTNLTNGGEGVPGLRKSAETRAKLSAALKGRRVTWAWKSALRNRGRKPSTETRAKMSAAGLGRRRSAESVAKTAEKLRGRVVSAEQREQIRQKLLGRKLPEEHKAKLRGRRHTDEARAKMSARRLGSTVGEMAKAKIADATRRRTGEQNAHYGHLNSVSRLVRRVLAGWTFGGLSSTAVAIDISRAKVGIMKDNVRPAHLAHVTHCRNGHEYNDRNTRYRENKGLECRQCQRDRAVALKAGSKLIALACCADYRGD